LKRIPHHEEMESLLLLKDAGTVMKKLKELNFDIIISGHRHTRHMQIELNETLNKKIYIINSPSLSKKGEMERGYYVMEFYDNRLEITYRQYNKDYFEEKEKSILNYSSNGFVKIK
jgi:predicted phosphodiesterase